MFCSKCGNQLFDNDYFCGRCGQKQGNFVNTNIQLKSVDIKRMKEMDIVLLH